MRGRINMHQINTHQSERIHARPTKPPTYTLLLCGAIIVFQIFLLVIAGYRNIRNINPDAVSYLRIAEYYVEGNFSLAITGYWGPLFSWLMVPPIAAGLEPLTAARLVMGMSAVIFLLGALLLYYTALKQLVLVLGAGFTTALFTIYWSAAGIAPDLLMGGLILAAIALTVRRSSNMGRQWLTAAGVLYGLAYLAKSVALPVSIGVVSVVLGLRIFKGEQTPSAGARTACFIALGLVCITGPWIAILSYHYGQPTFSTSAPINHALTGPGELARYHWFIRTHHEVEPGRITSWEDPDPAVYTAWHPFQRIDALRHQTRVIVENARNIVRNLQTFDLFGLGLAAVVLACLRPARRTVWEPWQLCAPLLAILAGIYLPVYALDTRYYLACLPIMLVVALNLFAGREEDQTLRGRQTAWLITFVIFASFLVRPVAQLGEALKEPISSPLELAEQLVSIVEEKSDSSLVSVGAESSAPFKAAYYAAFLTDHQYGGNRIDNPTARELTLRRNSFVVTEADSPLSSELRDSGSAQLISTIGHGPDRVSIHFIP